MPLKLLNFESAEDRKAFLSLVDRLRASVSGGSEMADAVAGIVTDVRTEGDAALVRYMRKWTNPEFTPEMIRVQPAEMASAEAKLDPALKQALARSIEHVRSYQTHILPKDPPSVVIDGAELGLRFTPIPHVGLTVPGGKAAYPSSVIMLAVPAQVAGVERLAVVSPPPTAMGRAQAGTPTDISPLVLGVCSMLGIDEVYRIGGAQAIAALAFGTETVRPVDYIAGPGNAFVQQAKRQVFGTVGIDGFFGPSEVVILADASANPRRVAADLIAQAEHDPGCCFLLSTSREVIERILQAVDEQMPQRQRQAAIEQALTNWSAAVVVPDETTALKLVDELAAEHVNLAVEDPKATLARLRHGGAWFLGDGSPVASGDYYAGPSHCLPTGCTARYSSGLSVYNFLKRSSVERYLDRPSDQAIDDIARLAEAEGLDGHAASVRARREG